MINNNIDNNNNTNREIMTFLQHCVGHFCNIALPQHDLVLRWGIFPSTTSSLLSDEEEVKCEASIYLAMGRYLAKLYFMTTKNDCSSAAACFVGKCSFCLDILNVTSLKS